MPQPLLARAGVLLAVLAPAATGLQAATLTPTRANFDRQVREARSHGYPHVDNLTHARQLVREGTLVRVPGNRDYEVASWVHPYAVPETKLFIERLAGQYRGACGEKLVVTSLLRPRDMKLPNSHPQSVHPTGMAIDFRVPANGSCRRWLETAFLNLERQRVLVAARERNPPHYHVVIFPRQYAAYVAQRTAGGPQLAKASSAPLRTHRVRPGENLWVIARSNGVTVASLRRANGLRTDTIRPGQVLTVPVR
jgi:LysM repeat protein